MDSLPPEVVHNIFARLDSSGVSTLRLSAQTYADIGAQYLAPRVRFHTSQSSIDRLQKFTTNSVLRHHVKSLTFEGRVLAQIFSFDEYASHWDNSEHVEDRPNSPEPGCSAREERLYQRNLAKFTEEVDTKYLKYHAIRQEQTKLVASSRYREVISSTIRSFPRLEEIILRNIGQCGHVLSQRMLETMPLDCGMPMSNDTENTVEQLNLLLGLKLHLGDTTKGSTEKPVERSATEAVMQIKSLYVHELCPRFFLQNLQPKIVQVFQCLKKIDLFFRMNAVDRLKHSSDGDLVYSEFKDGALRQALAAAHSLEHLCINIEDAGWHTPLFRLSYIVEDHSWPNLESLNVDCFSVASPSDLLGVLQRQPSLQQLYISLVSLDDGTWEDAIDLMRENLELNSFLAHGYLFENATVYNTNDIDVSFYMDEGDEFHMTGALDLYVTDKGYMEDPNGETPGFNPLVCLDWEDPDLLKARLEGEDSEFGSE